MSALARKQNEEFLPTRNELTEQLGGRWRGSNGSARCPAHDDRNASLSISEGKDGKWLAHCHAGCAQDAVIDKLRELGLWLERKSEQGDNGKAKLVAEYRYCKSGKLVYKICKFAPGFNGEKKTFRPCRPDGNGGWIWNLEGVPRVLYRVDELAAASPREWAFVVEGEKDVDRLVTRGFVAATNPGGAAKAGATKKWLPEFNEAFRGRRVAIIPDNDDVGREHAQYVAEQLLPVAAEVRIVELPDLPVHGDVSDFFEKGGTRERLLELVEVTPKLTELGAQFRKDKAAGSQQRTAAQSGPKPFTSALELENELASFSPSLSTNDRSQRLQISLREFRRSLRSIVQCGARASSRSSPSRASVRRRRSPTHCYRRRHGKRRLLTEPLSTSKPSSRGLREPSALPSCSKSLRRCLRAT